MSGGGKLTRTTLKNIVMLSKNMQKTSHFFTEILGHKVIHQTKNLAELKGHKDFRLAIKNISKYDTGDVIEGTCLKIACLWMDEGQKVSLTQVMLGMRSMRLRWSTRNSSKKREAPAMTKSLSLMTSSIN